MHYDAFYHGQIWLDTDGNPIHAHGGSMLYWEGKFYWYGENKEHSTQDEEIWHWGVRMYESTDLYNWRSCGIIIPPEPENPDSPLHPHSKMDRPHILYNAQTKKFVCWLKIMCEDGTQRSTVLTADDLLGPYTKVRVGLQPLGMNAGDFDLVAAPDGKAYYYFERVHSETICADLTPDYTDVTGYYTTHFPRPCPPFVREATAHFYRGGKHYLLTSGTTGYLPNPSELAVADTWHGPFRVLGNPHPEDPSNTSFHSQISCVFKVPGKKDLYIAMADRWAPELLELSYEKYARKFHNAFDPSVEAPEDPEVDRVLDTIPDTAKARYVWLPIRFDGEMGYIHWRDSWDLEEFEDI